MATLIFRREAPGRGRPDAALERSVRARGRRLLRALRGGRSGGGPQGWVSGALMGLAMGSEARKTALLRFVDVLPALKTPQAVIRHLEEYLLQPDVPLPPGVGPLLTFCAGTPALRPLFASCVQQGVGLASRRFIAGGDAPSAARAALALRGQCLAATFDLLGEAVTGEAEARAYQQTYLSLIAALADRAADWPAVAQLDAAPFGPAPRVNVSLKLSALSARFDPMAADATAEAVKERLRPILSLARARGVFVNVDMEQHDFCAITRRIFEEVLCEPEYRDWADVGIVTQAYLRRSEDDLRRLRDWARRRGTPVWVRLVKGAYWDYETILAVQQGRPVPVYQDKAETDANFEGLTAFLLDNWQALRPAIATHNVRSAAHAQALAAARDLPARAVEYQVLYGRGEPLGRALASQGERVRVYVPFGELLPGMAYLVRRLLENTSNDSFLRGLSSGRRSAAALLAPPVPARVEAPGAEPTAFTNEPETDFAVPDNQARMRQALETVRGALGETVPVVVAGQVQTRPGAVERRDPSDLSRVASRVCYATPADAEAAVAAASAAFAPWRDAPVPERAGLLRRVAAEFRRRRWEIAAWQVYEVGKPWREADADVAEAIDFCEFYARERERLAAPRRRDVPGEWNEYFYDARGPAVVIAPWNFPLAILTGMTVAALVAGNPVVMKPAEQSSRVGYFLMEALAAAGVPPGVANFLPGDGETLGPLLVNDPRVAVVAFTGSQAVGLSILKDAAQVRPGQREVKRVVAEMGGKNAVIVDEDADLDEAVPGVLASAVSFAGQKCSACARVIVVGSAYGAFCQRLAEAMQSLVVGTAEDPATALGPVVGAEARARVREYVEIGGREGRLLAQAPVPEALAGRGHYVPASVFVECPPGGRLCQEEIFGPVLAVLRARDLTEALALAADSPYALTGGFYSRSPENVARARREFRVGNLYVNRRITGALVDRQPFGGAAMSGVGAKAGGPDYLLQFLTPRTVTESVMRRGFAPGAAPD